MDDARGHALAPHTADVVVEAWAPTVAGCYEEAVAGVVGVFARVDDDPERGARDADDVDVRVVDVGPGAPDELLVLLLEEVVAIADTSGRVPRTATVTVDDGHLLARFELAPLGTVEVVGPVPKGVSYQDLEFGPGAGRTGAWRCRATVDV